MIWDSSRGPALYFLVGGGDGTDQHPPFVVLLAKVAQCHLHYSSFTPIPVLMYLYNYCSRKITRYYH